LLFALILSATIWVLLLEASAFDWTNVSAK